MKLLLAAMLVMFALSGTVFLMLGLRELLRMLTVRHRLVRATGTIVGVRRKTSSIRSSGRFKTLVMNFPIITFSKQTGESVKFTSETGDSGSRSRYVAGNSINVLYDPRDALKPMLDTWTGVWLPGLMLLLSSAGFFLGAWLIYWCFADRLLGPSA